MAKHKKKKKANAKAKKSGIHPTIGAAFITGQKAENIFAAWLPEEWLRRDEDPDFHVDYNIEIAREGEPTGRAIRVQLKGRTAKIKNGKVKESFKTKHLRYYLKCELPVFLFRINPNTGAGYWLFIQGYLREKRLTAEQLAKQRDLTIEFDPSRSLVEKEPFKQAVAEALQFMREELTGSPTDAIRAHERRLKALDPQIEVSIRATNSGMEVTLNPRNLAQVPAPTLHTNFTPQQFEALQRGEPISTRASQVSANTPILQEMLLETGEHEITLEVAGHRTPGSVQLAKEGAAPFDTLQINGEYRAFPQRLQFEAPLPDSPLCVQASWTGNNPAEFGNPLMNFGFQFREWAAQPLLSLAHFDDLRRLTSPGAVSLRLLVRGSECYRGKLRAEDMASEPWLTNF